MTKIMINHPYIIMIISYVIRMKRKPKTDHRKYDRPNVIDHKIFVAHNIIYYCYYRKSYSK